MSKDTMRLIKKELSIIKGVVDSHFYAIAHDEDYPTKQDRKELKSIQSRVKNIRTHIKLQLKNK